MKKLRKGIAGIITTLLFIAIGYSDYLWFGYPFSTIFLGFIILVLWIGALGKINNPKRFWVIELIGFALFGILYTYGFVIIPNTPLWLAILLGVGGTAFLFLLLLGVAAWDTEINA